MRFCIPTTTHYAGKELRLKQQYFFISASVQRAVKKYKEKHDDIRKFYEKATFHMNDTHPTVAVAELMRILLDEENLGWDEAWEITTKTCAYTNHTIMSEALEKWPIELFSRLLPRIYQIVEEINRRFVEEIQKRYPGNQEKVRKMAIIYDGQVRMAHLAIVGSYSVNGVAKLHTEILEKQELRDFYEMMPRSSTTRPTASPRDASCSTAIRCWRTGSRIRSATSGSRICPRSRSCRCMWTMRNASRSL